VTEASWRPRLDTKGEADPGDFHFRVDVPFGPRWHHVELLRMSILQCLATIFQNHDFCDQLGMVTAELLENAIHYGHWDGAAEHPFRLSVRGFHGDVVIEVANPIDPSTHNGARLKRITERLAAAASPKEAYVNRLREIADSPEEVGSGLGLLRVAYETNCKLDVKVEDGLARIIATIAAAPSGHEGGKP
jgi:hypothetical protein